MFTFSLHAARLLRACSALALCVGGFGMAACSGQLPDSSPSGDPSAPGNEPSLGNSAGGSNGAGSNAAGSNGAGPGNSSSEPGASSGGNGSAEPSPPGSAGTSPSNAPDPNTPTDCEALDPSASVLRRLSRVEYRLTLKELFALDSVPSVDSLPEDSDFKGFRTVAALQNVTTEHLRAYQSEADKLAAALFEDSPEAAARRDAVLGCDPEVNTCLNDFITRFGRVAYRRAVTDAERTDLMTLADAGGTSTKDRFTTVIAGMLSSASFLFRVELGDQKDGLSTLRGEELAAKLSFALIGRGPSAELLDRGANGELDTPEGLRSAAQELLADARAQEFYQAFFQQWLGFERMRPPKVPDPGWNDALLVSMQEETTRLLTEYAWGQGANFLDSITANHTYVRADLAEFYGLPTPAADGYVEFPSGHDRAGSGLLSHAALISAKNDGDRVAHRGAWVQRTFLCLDLQVPTALLDSVADELAGLSYQQMLDYRGTDSACAGCHAQIDPIGVGFSAYDEIGHFTPDVDTHQYGITPALPGGAPFETLAELAAQLRQRANLADCVTSKLFLYTGGREATNADSCAVKRAATQFTADQNRFASILEGLVASPDFRVRRAPEPNGTAPSEEASQ